MGERGGPTLRPVDGLSPAIGSHRLLGNGRSCALLTPAAEIDWWCAPIDSAPLLWSLLDRAGSSARFPGARVAGGDDAPAGPTARTTLSIRGERFEVWDALLPVAGGGSAIVRLLRAIDGPIEVDHELGIGGFGGDRGIWRDGHAQVAGADVHVTGGSADVSGPVLRTRLSLDARWSALVIACGSPVAPDADALCETLLDAERCSDLVIGRTRLPKLHPERAMDALLVLEACTFQESGAVVASPTTSVPEAPGGDRQFDYRFTWLRDASLAVSVASLLGHGRAAERYLSFVHQVVGDGGAPTAPMTDVRGGDVPDEREVDGIAGWAGSLPIRTGNAAADQVQYDALGLLLEAISVYLQTGGRLDPRTWKIVCAVADQVASVDDPVSSGIWELREPQPLVSADIGRWIALDRAIWIARGWHPLTRRRRWRQARDRARNRVVDSLTGDGALPQAYDQQPPRLDASGLMAVIFGLLDRDDPRASAVVDTMIAGLGSHPHLYRYEPDESDGFSGREGAFTPASWWAAAALAQTGRVAEARSRVDDLCAALPRLMAEEFDPERGSSLGNVPLVWSHIEAARTMYILDAEVLRQRWGTAGLWVWRLVRYVRLRRTHRNDESDISQLPELRPMLAPPDPVHR